MRFVNETSISLQVFTVKLKLRGFRKNGFRLSFKISGFNNAYMPVAENKTKAL